MREPKDLATICLTSMIKVLAQTKNLRRGHNGQGKLKTIRLSAEFEGYAEYMAPKRMEQIRSEVESAQEDLSDVFTAEILKPAMDSYLTPEWDELLPFPTSEYWILC